jgi:hypothetical protein
MSRDINLVMIILITPRTIIKLSNLVVNILRSGLILIAVEELVVHHESLVPLLLAELVMGRAKSFFEHNK